MFILLLFLSLEIRSQSFIEIGGHITDKQTKESIPYAHVYLENTSIGTVSNSEGYYILKIDSSQNYKSLIVSCIGYNNAKVNLENNLRDSLNVILSISPTILKEVIVTPGGAVEIIKKAIKRIPNNYSTKPVYLVGFYREVKTALNTGPLYVLEVLLKTYKESYLIASSNKKRKIRMLKSRKKTLEHVGIKFNGGIYSSFGNDIIAKKDKFFSKVITYNLKEITRYNEREVYVITYLSDFSKGYIYVDTKSFAITKLNTVYTKRGIKNRNEQAQNINLEWYNGSVESDYKLFNGKWYLQNIIVKSTAYDKLLLDTISATSEYITTLIDTVKVKPFSKRAKKGGIKYKDPLMDKIYNNDPNFWENYNILAETEELKRFFREESKR